MHRKKNNNKKKRKPTQRSRNPYGNMSTSVITSRQRPGMGFLQPRVLTTLKYYSTVDIVVAALTADIYTFRLNSIFDPDKTGTGHQPYGRDTLAALYNRYRVLTTRWLIEVPSTSDSLALTVIPHNGPLPVVPVNASTFAAASESPFSTTKTVGFGGSPPARFTRSVHLNELVGYTPTQYNADDLTASTMGGNPGEDMDLSLIAFNPSSSSVEVRFMVSLWYSVVVFDPIIQGQS